MTRHAKKKHPKEWKLIEEKAANSGQTLTKLFKKPIDKVAKYKSNSMKRIKLNEKLVKMISLDMRPISIVQGQGFREFVAELDPSYTLPSTKTLREKLIPRQHNKTMKTVLNELDNVNEVSLTMDGWSSPNAEKYNAYTIHYIDWSVSEPKLTTKILECSHFDKRSTAIELEKDLRRVTEKHGIIDKLVLTVADNATDVQLAMDIFGKSNIGCVAHTLNLCAKWGVKHCPEVETLQAKLAKIVRTTKVGHRAKKSFTKCRRKVGLIGKTALVSYCQTRFHTLYLMAERALELKDALLLFSVEYKIEDPLNEKDWKLLDEMVVVLRKLYLMTVELSSETMTTTSKVIPMVNILLESYSIVRKKESKIGKEFRLKILEELKTRFKDTETDEVFAHSTILDPRFKTKAFGSTTNSNDAVNSVKAEAIKIAHETNRDDIPEESEANNQDEKIDSKKDNYDEFWSKFDQKLNKKPSKRVRETDYWKECVDLEMRKYLSLPYLERKSNPIIWWKNIGSKQFPLLFQTSKKYSCMTATSVPSERVFSKAGHIINQKRTRLDPRTANELITLSTNLK